MLCVGGRCDGQWVDANTDEYTTMVEKGDPRSLADYKPTVNFVALAEKITAWPYRTWFLTVSEKGAYSKRWFLVPPGQSDHQTVSLLMDGYRKGRQ